MSNKGVGVVLAALLSGCASLGEERSVPEAVRAPPPGDLQLLEALSAIDKHLGTRVRWGGTVVTTSTPSPGHAEAEVVERKLDAEGRPKAGTPSDGRFVVRFASSEEPVFRAGDEITAAGVIVGSRSGMIGREEAEFPIVQNTAAMRWELAFDDYRGGYHYPYPYPYYPYPGLYPWYPFHRFGYHRLHRHY